MTSNARLPAGIAIVTLAALAALALAITPAAAAAPAAIKPIKKASCGVVQGPTHALPGRKTDTRYLVEVFYKVGGNRATCSFATRWMRKLASKQFRSKVVGTLGPDLKGGPAGWSCTAAPVPGGMKSAARGMCWAKGSILGEEVFTWTPALGEVDKSAPSPCPGSRVIGGVVYC
jgi:hypothetical protein